jgi:hypothetical protein
MKSKTAMATGGCMLFVMYMVNSYFSGKVVGRIPFEPWGMLTNMSHRGLSGDDMQEFSLVFVYMLL